MRQYLCVSVWLFSDKLLKMSVFLPRISQKEESVEQPEFRYDEFGFRVDKEGKSSPVPPTCIVFSPSHAFKCGRILQPFCAKSCLPTCFYVLPFVIKCIRCAGLMEVQSIDYAAIIFIPLCCAMGKRKKSWGVTISISSCMLEKGYFPSSRWDLHCVQ